MKTLLLLLLPFIVFSQNKYSYKNLALEGGGIRGLAYPGALKVLEEKGILKDIENVAGTSAGAITALMISLDYSAHEIDSILYTLKVKRFNDGKDIFGKIWRIKNEYGIFKGARFEKWLGQIIQHKTGNPNITFLELHQLHLKNDRFKELYCTGTNITRQNLQVFSWKHTPQMQVKTAVHISGCIPLYFKPVAMDSNWQQVSIRKNTAPYDLYVDGGMLSNYPVNMFDTCINGGNPLLCDDVKYNTQTLGLKLERSEQIDHFNNNLTNVAAYKIGSVNDYTTALLNLTMEALNRKTEYLENERGRTIYISHGKISGKIKRVSPETKKQLFDNGVKAAEKFFTKDIIR